MNRWWLMVLAVVLLSACQGTEEPQGTTEPTASVTSAPGEVSEPTPSVTSTAGQITQPTASLTSTTGKITEPRARPTSTTGEIMEVEAWEIKQAADGTYYIPDRGDGCAYFDTGLTGDIMLWATPPVPPQCVAGWYYNGTTGRINPVVP